jgi:hypothetical protein
LRSRVAVLVVALALPLDAVGGQARLQIRGTVDGAWFDTDTGSNLLNRNEGRPVGVGRALLWGAVEPVRRLAFYGMLEAEAETAPDAERELELEQYGMRYAPSRYLSIDAGKLVSPLSAFAPRRFAWRNPLVGEPEIYPVQYPHGVVITGAARAIDVRVAALSLPLVNTEYTPEPTPTLRPAIAIGITPLFGLRLGVGYTVGPYLNDTLSATQLDQRSWRSFAQRVYVADMAWSFGYLELFAEGAISSYDVPMQSEPVKGTAYYGEARYTFSPRMFVAARLERNDYPFIMPVSATAWVARRTDFRDHEFGVGFRPAAGTLLKASYRADWWTVNSGNAAFVRPGGHAVALQLSQQFDVMNWIERARVR